MRIPRATPIAITPVRRISTTTAIGQTKAITAKSGYPTRDPTGLLTARVAGFMNLTMAGRGFPTSLGAGHHITTAAGSCMAAAGLGGQGRSQPIPPITRYGRQHTYRSSDSAVVLELASALADSAASVGSHLGQATGATLGGAVGEGVKDLALSAAKDSTMDSMTDSVRSEKEYAGVSSQTCAMRPRTPAFAVA